MSDKVKTLAEPVLRDGVTPSSGEQTAFRELIAAAGLDALTALQGRMDALEHVPMVINSFVASPSVVEVGFSGIVNFIFSWSYNKFPVSQSINQGIGAVTPATATSVNVNVDISATTVFTLLATDGTTHTGNTATRNVTVSFQHKAYWGYVTTTDIPNSAAVLGLANSAFGTARQREIVIDNPNTGGYPVYCYPATWGEPTFMDGSFESANWERIQVTLNKANGHTSAYLWFRLRDMQFTSGSKFQVL